MRAARYKSRWLVLALVAAALLVFVLANAHLLYVAFQSQPDCVGHLKERAGEGGQYRAAKSAC
ncbi:hypothetical protein [Sphingobium vermicomposti]|uniref:Uncharacterized protein n=1 Tax=Sphingobium vermicomposti TaxID=529005 RepID=A0A846M066_9SPHN|nr:hypothetical protein [Sphingobium vermicomposti]NIJ15439.1 hypothetical protein [Sphingobium vermicomposti]